MTDPNENKQDKCDTLDCAEQTLHQSVSQEHPEWVSENGDCDSCVSIEHEMAADPNSVPKDLES